MNAATPPKPPPPPPRASGKAARAKPGDKIEVIKVLVLAIVSFLAGFALVFLFLRPTPPTDDTAADVLPAPDPAPPTDAPPPAADEGYAPSEPPGATEPVADEGAAPDDEGDAPDDEGDAPPEVPPGKTPDGVLIDGSAFYLKCWDDEGVEHKGPDCDELRVLEKRFATRLYVVDKCRQDAGGGSGGGKLSVALEVDFAANKISFWNGASSDIKNAAQIGTCLRDALAGLPIHGIDHKFARYRVFHTVLFGDAAAKQQKKEAAQAAKYVAGKGKMVDVIKDRVRVRASPKDGEIIGKISTGNQVRLLDKQGGWCHVVTPNKNDGWMICDALAQ